MDLYIKDGWHKTSKTVIINEKEYVTILQASRSLKINESTVRNRINSKTDKWTKWEYK